MSARLSMDAVLPAPTQWPHGQRGIALLLVLWLTALLTVIAGGFAYAMRNEALAARNTMSQAQARTVADGAVQRMAFELMRPRTLLEAWNPDGVVHGWIEPDGSRVAVNALDESGKIDVNFVPDALLKNLLQTVGQVDVDTAARLVDAIGDWKDPDDLRRPNGAEAPEYQAAGLSYKPANAQFETVAELQRVLGITPAIYARVAGSLTTFSGMPGINPAYASRGVLMALPGATDAMVDTYIGQRSAALAARQPLPMFPLAGGGGSGANTWRIHAEVTTADGAVYIREAVVRPGNTAARPLLVLEWQQGDVPTLAAADAAKPAQ